MTPSEALLEAARRIERQAAGELPSDPKVRHGAQHETRRAVTIRHSMAARV